MDIDDRTFHARVEREDSVGTLEAILAAVRRGGLALHSLRMAPGRHGIELHLRLNGNADALALCRTRLSNMVGIAKLRVLVDGREPFRPADAACSYGRADARVTESPHDYERSTR